MFAHTHRGSALFLFGASGSLKLNDTKTLNVDSISHGLCQQKHVHTR